MKVRTKESEHGCALQHLFKCINTKDIYNFFMIKKKKIDKLWQFAKSSTSSVGVYSRREGRICHGPKDLHREK